MGRAGARGPSWSEYSLAYWPDHVTNIAAAAIIVVFLIWLRRATSGGLTCRRRIDLRGHLIPGDTGVSLGGEVFAIEVPQFTSIGCYRSASWLAGVLIALICLMPGGS